MELFETQPYSNITIKEEPIDEEYFMVEEVFNEGSEQLKEANENFNANLKFEVEYENDENLEENFRNLGEKSKNLDKTLQNFNDNRQRASQSDAGFEIKKEKIHDEKSEDDDEQFEVIRDQFKVKEEPEETFTIEEYFDANKEIKEEKLDEEILEVINEQVGPIESSSRNFSPAGSSSRNLNKTTIFKTYCKRVGPARTSVSLENAAKRFRHEIKEEPELNYEDSDEDQFEIILPKNNQNSPQEIISSIETIKIFPKKNISKKVTLKVPEFLPKNLPKVEQILLEHNYYKFDKFYKPTIALATVSRIETDEDGISYEEVNLLESEKVKLPLPFYVPRVKPKTALKCPECPTILEDTLRLNRHMRLHKAPQFQCKNCLKWFKRESTLHNHVCDLRCSVCVGVCKCEIDTSSKNCKICQKIDFRYFSDYKRHMVEFHNEVVICEICEKNKYTLFKHKQQNHKMETHYKCPHCPLVLKTTELLEEHKQKHSDIFKCSKCTRQFTRKFLLQEHEKLHENPMAFYCKKCDKSFRGKFCLTNHLWTIHKEVYDKNKEVKVYNHVDREGWMRCPNCPLLFRNRDSLNKHADQSHSKSLRRWNPYLQEEQSKKLSESILKKAKKSVEN